MSTALALVLCVAAFWLGGVLGFLTAAMLTAGARADKDSGGFH